MAYKIAYRSCFERDFKKLKSYIQNYVLDIADRIQAGTLQGEMLKGNFQGFYKFPFGHKPEYRLVYKIYECRINKESNPKCMFDDIYSVFVASSRECFSIRCTFWRQKNDLFDLLIC